MATVDIVSLSGSYTHCKPLFSLDGKLLFTSCGSILQILSTQTGELIHRLYGHSANITSIIHHPTKSNHIISSSYDGLIIVWNIETYNECFQITLPLTIIEIIPSLSSSLNQNLQDLPNELILIVERSSKDKDPSGDESYKVVIYNLVKMKIRKNISDLKHTSNCCDLLPSSKTPQIPFNYLVVANKRKLIFWSLGAQFHTESIDDRPPLSKGYPGEQIQTICSSSSTTISSLVVCSERDMIITGHESGEITLWHNISTFLSNAMMKQQEKMTHEPFAPPPCTLLHWHAHPVLSLSLSSDSTHVYSGGHEGVLVCWQLATSSHTFVPRLGGTILKMSSNKENSFVVVACSDNSLKLVNAATMREDWMIQSPCLGLSNKDIALAGTTIIDPQTHPSGGIKYSKIQLGVNPVTGNVVTNGYPGQLQMTDITSLPIDPQTPSKSSSFVTDAIQVLAYNRISRTENPLSGFDRDRQAALTHLKYYVPSIVQFLFHTFPSQDHTDEKYYLATVDLYRGEELDPDCSLKIWNYSALEGTQRKYVLVTQVDRPHGSHGITSMAFFTSNPLRPSLATTSTDGMVKIWAASMTPSNHSFPWICLYSFTYRSCVAGGLSASQDSSLLAIGYGTALTFWDPNTAELKGNVQLHSSSPITNTSFIEPRYSTELGGGCGLVYVVAVCSDSIHVVNILSLEILWSRKGNIFSFSSAPSDSYLLKFSDLIDENKSNPIEHTSLKRLSSEGWLAVCMKDNETSDPQVHIFSPISETPLCSINSSAVQMTFWRSPDPTFHYSRGLIIITKESQLILYTPSSTSTSSSSSSSSSSYTPIKITHHQSYRKKLIGKEVQNRSNFLQNVLSAPITLKEEKRKRHTLHSDSESDTEEKDLELTSRRQKKMLTKISSEIFDSSSSSLPPLSAIYEDYMKKMLNDSNPTESSASVESSTQNVTTSLIPQKMEAPPNSVPSVIDRKRIRSQLASVFASSSTTIEEESSLQQQPSLEAVPQIASSTIVEPSVDEEVEVKSNSKKPKRSKKSVEEVKNLTENEPVTSTSNEPKEENQVTIEPPVTNITEKVTEELKESEKTKSRKGKKGKEVAVESLPSSPPVEVIPAVEGTKELEKPKSRKGKKEKEVPIEPPAVVVEKEVGSGKMTTRSTKSSTKSK